MKYSLSDTEILNSLLINNKDRFIKKIDWSGSVYSEQDVIDFFKRYSNFENKIDWNKSTDEQKAQIIKLIDDTKIKSDKKSDIKNLFNSDEFEIIGEDNDFVYVAPLTWNACKFIDSYDCGGQGATWCIGWEKSDEYWRGYVYEGDVFILMMRKPKAKRTIIQTLLPMCEETEEEFYDDDNDEYYYDYVVRLNEREWEDYDDGNKVMFQINGRYVTAWEQSDDFSLFGYERLDDVIDTCNLGFEFTYEDYERLNDKLIERIEEEQEHLRLMEERASAEIAFFDEKGHLTVDFDKIREYNEYYDFYALRDLVQSNFKYLKFIGTFLSDVYMNLVRGWGFTVVDLSEVVFDDCNMSMFCETICITLDLSSPTATNIEYTYNFFKYSRGIDRIENIILHPNCDELIEGLKQGIETYSTKYGDLKLRLTVKGHNENQGSLDLEFDNGIALEPSYDYIQKVN